MFHATSAESRRDFVVVGGGGYTLRETSLARKDGAAGPGRPDTDEWRENSIFDARCSLADGRRVASRRRVLGFSLSGAARVNPAPETRQSESTTGKYRLTVADRDSWQSRAVGRTVITSMITSF